MANNDEEKDHFTSFEQNDDEEQRKEARNRAELKESNTVWCDAAAREDNSQSNLSEVQR